MAPQSMPLHGAINFMFQGFGTPRESIDGKIPKEEYRALWLDGEYTTGFKNRSPRTCIKANTAAHHGCEECRKSVPNGTVDSSSIPAERYCLCILANVRDASKRNEIPKFKSTCLSTITDATTTDKAASGSFTRGALSKENRRARRARSDRIRIADQP